MLFALPDFLNSGAAQVLAATTGEGGATSFLDSGLGGIIKAIAGAVGFLVGVFGVLKAIGAFLGGKMGQGFKVIIATMLIAGILFNLDLLIDFADWIGSLVKEALTAFEDFG